MKLLNILNPQKWLGQLAVLGCFFFGGSAATLWFWECPPQSVTNTEVNQKFKKSQVTPEVLGTVDCVEWLRSLDKKGIRELRQ